MEKTGMGMDHLKELYQKRKEQAINDFFTFLRFESISTEPGYSGQVNACAKWLQNYLSDIGFETELWPTAGHPVLFASCLKAGPSKPTLLIYNHYDVQPVDPLEEWISQPFKPEVRKGQVYARGAQDNKGQCFYVIQALKALIETNQELPINVKLCIEGEEEAGSAGLSGILKDKREELKADYLVIADVGIPGPNTPAVTLGMRGLVALDVELKGSFTDLHSGSHGGIAYNPIHALVEVLAKLRDANGRILVPGFYDDVKEMPEQFKKMISFDFDPLHYEATFGVVPSGGEKEFLPIERNWLRPTLEINGISGGYSGPGFKTVIPAKAHAKISCRLVADQDPLKIGKLVAKHIEKLAPHGIEVKATVRPGGGVAIRANPDSKLVQAFAKAFTDVFNRPCKYEYGGASIPIVPELTKASGSEVVLVGLGLGDDCIHAPNEHFGLDRFEKGFLMMARALDYLSQ